MIKSFRVFSTNLRRYYTIYREQNLSREIHRI